VHHPLRARLLQPRRNGALHRPGGRGGPRGGQACHREQQRSSRRRRRHSGLQTASGAAILVSLARTWPRDRALTTLAARCARSPHPR
jgi:hypothetical protein